MKLMSWIIIGLALGDIVSMSIKLVPILKDLRKASIRGCEKRFLKMSGAYLANWLVIFYCINVLMMLK